jgi:NAD(P)-dependent dehydrogenase (short-subunit alcohol dehydrogenase family)
VRILADQRYEDKVVVITGGGAGIGRTFGLRFAAEGASIVVADLDASVGERMVGELAESGYRGVSFQMDVRDASAAARMAAAAVERFGGIDILVNNAGIHLDHAQLPFTLDAVPAWRDVLDVNVIGALICSAACRRAMAARGGGAIVNMSSMAAYGGGGAYSVSKLALNSLTVGLAGAYGGDGIRVNAIAPGLVDSEAAVEWWSDPSRSGLNIQEQLIGGQVIKRQGRMHDLADMALFLCSEQASFVTGQTFLVDGGYTKKPF